MKNKPPRYKLKKYKSPLGRIILEALKDFDLKIHELIRDTKKRGKAK